MKKKRIMNVVKTSYEELEKQWGFFPHYPPQNPAKVFVRHELYIRCNVKGKVNWDLSPVYTKQELEERGNFNIVEKIEEIVAEELIESTTGKGLIQV